MKRWFAWLRQKGALLSFVVLLMLPARLLAVQATLAADAHVSQTQPAVNGGTLSNLNVGGGYTSLLQFDLGVLPTETSAAQIARATLRLYCNRADTAGSLSLQPVYAAWTETGVTYNTLPVLGTSLGSTQVSAANGFITLDVTAQVQGWVSAPGSNYGLALTSTSAVLQFDSKENDETGHLPQLEIVLTASNGAGAKGATGVTGPTGPTGATGLVGAAGATGAAGVAGLPGATGATGPAGPAGAGLVNYRGLYTSSTNYANGDVVSFAGSAYISQSSANHGNTPGVGSAWGLLAGVGATGATGAAGTTGAAGQQGPPGFGLQGTTGATGAMGATGATGTPGLMYQGAYSSSRSYALGDVVVWNGSSFVSLASSNHGNTPGTVPGQWGVLTSQGPAGEAGSVGAAGPTGATGALGPVGPPGERGAQGAQGIAGQAGAQGLPGPTGTQGLQGPIGATGAAGPVGLSFQGAYSASTNYGLGQGVFWAGAGWVSLRENNHGNTPDQSPQSWAMFASAGANGATGATGLGVQGATGATGAAGSNGHDGATGATGVAGTPGLVYQGTYSAAGNYTLGDVVVWNGTSYVSLLGSNRGNTPGTVPGTWGILVSQGAAGAPGVAGPQGNTGATGVVGPMGSVGPQGAQGLPGPMGAAGTPGAPGQTGPTGPAGPAGVTGATGIAGPAGAQGIAGAVGPTGSQGPAGPTGAAGPVGLTFLGTYSASRHYSRGDGVQWQGAGWVSLLDSNLGHAPDGSPSAWAMFAAPGGQGATGATGVGLTGPPGVTGATGAAGVAGATGATGAIGPAGMRFEGAYNSAAGYSQADSVTYKGSTYLSLQDNNHGNAPDVSPAAWALLAAQGSSGQTGAMGLAGATGSTGAAGPAGGSGATGAAGATGATGTQGLPGIVFRAAWNGSTRYNTNDAVTFAGSTYLALAGNTGQEPDQVPQTWAILAEAGGVGPTGMPGTAGAAATVIVGAVNTLPAGSQATVTNSGTSTAAVLNFGIPQGTAGSGGTGNASPAPRVPAMYHAVSFNFPYYSINAPTSSALENGTVLGWMAQACTATRLDVYSQQSGTIRVTLRLGSATVLNNTALSCSASTNTSCVATGGVPVTAGQFMDLLVTGASGTAAGVWMALECDP